MAGRLLCDLKILSDTLSCVVFVLIVTCPTGVRNVETYSVNGMSVRQFEDLPNVVEVECSGRTLGPQVNLFSLTLYAIEEDVVLASVTINPGECGTSSSFSACFIDKDDPFNTRLKTLVVDLGDGEERRYGCNVSMNTAGRPAIVHWAITASHIPTEVAYGTPWAGSTTVNPGYTTFTDTDLAIAAEVQESQLADVQIPSSAVIAGLVLLVLFIVLTIVMIIVRHKASAAGTVGTTPQPPRPKTTCTPNPTAPRSETGGRGKVGPSWGGRGLSGGHAPSRAPPTSSLPPPPRETLGSSSDTSRPSMTQGTSQGLVSTTPSRGARRTTTTTTYTPPGPPSRHRRSRDR